MVQISVVDFKGLYQENYSCVQKIVVKYGFRDAQADDIVQESFLIAWEKRSTLKKIESFAAWIRTIARNLCLVALRSRTWSLSSTFGDFQEEAAGKGEWGEEPVDPGSAVGESWMKSLEREHSLLLLAEAVRAYKVEPRATIGRMHYLEQTSVKSISQALSLKQNTVLSHLRRFRRDLSDIMLARGEEQFLCVS